MSSTTALYQRVIAVKTTWSPIEAGVGKIVETSKSKMKSIWLKKPTHSFQESLQSHASKTLSAYTGCPLALAGQLGDVCWRLVCYVQ